MSRNLASNRSLASNRMYRSNIVFVAVPPSNVAATTISNVAIDVSWTDTNSGAVAYKVQRSSDGLTGWSTVITTSVGATIGHDTGLTSSTKYYYRVLGTNGAGDSAPSSVVNATTSGPAPNAPTSLTATDDPVNSGTQINLAWTNNGGGDTGTHVDKALDSGFSSGLVTISLNGSGQNSYSYTGLTGSTTYWFRVRTFNLTGDSTNSNSASASTTSANPPNTPSSLTATAASSSQINLTWTNNGGGDTSTEVLRALDSGFTSSPVTQTINSAGASSFSDTGLISSTTYYYKVRTHNNNGYSSYSNVANASTSSAPLNVSSAHPRLFSSTRLTTATTNWNAAPPTVSSTDTYLNALGYAVTGNATYLSNASNLLFSESASSLGWLMNWAYQGTLGQPSFVAVGSYATELSSVASDNYRRPDWVVLCFDLIFNGLTQTQINKFISGWTTTWPVSGTYFGQTVTIPGMGSLVNYFMTKQNIATVGGITYPNNNYSWGYFRHALNYALTCWYEDANAQNIYSLQMGSNSFWSHHLSDTGHVGGVPCEGTEYGKYAAKYPLMPLLALKDQGRNPFAESSYWKDMITWFVYNLSPQRVNAVSASDYQMPTWSDYENGSGYGTMELAGGGSGGTQAGDWSDFFQIYAANFPTTTEGKYARQFLSLINPAPTTTQFWSLFDPGGTTSDWTAAGLALAYNASGSDYATFRNNWTTNASVILFQGITPLSGVGHSHSNPGCIQWVRGNQWLTRESPGYSANYASIRVQSTVAASPAPTTTTFTGNNLPTSNFWFNGLAPVSVQFTSGALAGTRATVSSYNGTGLITLSSALTQAPSAGDGFYVITINTLSDSDIGSHCCCTFAGTTGATTGYANGSISQAFALDIQPKYMAMGMNLGNLYSGPNQPTHPSYTPNYCTTYVRELYWIPVLESLVVLDRLQLQDWSGNTYYPAWTATACPTHFLLHTPGTVNIDGSNKFTFTNGTHVLRGFTMLPASPGYLTVNTNDFTGTKQSASWYQNRLEVQDSGSAQRYFLHVLQGRDSTGTDATVGLVDNGNTGGANGAGTWTLTITLGANSATLTISKGMTAAEATVVVSP